MPALVKSKVGSWAGTSDDERTAVWPRRRKYSRNLVRISLPVIGALLYAAVFPRVGQVATLCPQQGAHHVPHRGGRISASQQVLREPGGRPGRPRSPLQGREPAARGLERPLGLAHFLEGGGE